MRVCGFKCRVPIYSITILVAVLIVSYELLITVIPNLFSVVLIKFYENIMCIYINLLISNNMFESKIDKRAGKCPCAC